MIVGLPGAFEAEAVDRDHMRLPEQMDALVAAVTAAQPRTAVVLCNGAPVEMPWVAGAKAVLEMYLGGQAQPSHASHTLHTVIYVTRYTRHIRHTLHTSHTSHPWRCGVVPLATNSMRPASCSVRFATGGGYTGLALIHT